jgi:acetylornithine deacetylase
MPATARNPTRFGSPLLGPKGLGGINGAEAIAMLESLQGWHFGPVSPYNSGKGDLPMDPLPIASELVAVPSVSSQTNFPVADVTARWMERAGFTIERLDFVDRQGITQANLVGKKGAGAKGLAYFGHNDVVPVDSWSFPQSGPFQPSVHSGRLYGRGSCDMKGSVAAFLAAAARIPEDSLTAPVYFICTADEEIGLWGAKDVAERSQIYREIVARQAAGIIGEPTELDVVYAHKGAYCFRVIARGRASHSSTREGKNANWSMIPFLGEMHRIYHETRTDPAWLNAEFDPPDVSMNLLISDHEPALNITAPESVCRIGFRPMPGQEPDRLLDRIRHAATTCGLEFQEMWTIAPLRTDLRSEFIQDVLKITGKPQARTVGYGTDGSYFTELKNLVVLGPGSIKQAHTDDEWISLDQLQSGANLYERMIRRWCTAGG